MNHRSENEAMGLTRGYLTALQAHLTRGSRESLRVAEEMGRLAVAAKLGTSDLAKIHEQALISLIAPGDSSRINDGKMARASAFFIAALTPIENNHPPAARKGGRLNQLNGVMHRRTDELAATRMQLKSESIRRRTLEVALRKSEKHYAQLLKRSHRMQEHLRHLSHELLSAQEDERKRISRELHDEIGQTLTAINVKLATLKREATLNTKNLKRTISSTQRLVERSMNTVHRFARELRPPLLDDLGLIPALHAHMKTFTRRTGIPIHFVTFAAVERLDSDGRTVLYRVAQEALLNIDRHAHASKVNVRIHRVKDFVRMEIHDNGRSFDSKRVSGAKRISGLGLLGMRERVEMVGGRFVVESERGKGTTIHAELPFHDPKA